MRVLLKYIFFAFVAAMLFKGDAWLLNQPSDFTFYAAICALPVIVYGTLRVLTKFIKSDLEKKTNDVSEE